MLKVYPSLFHMNKMKERRVRNRERGGERERREKGSVREESVASK